MRASSQVKQLASTSLAVVTIYTSLPFDSADRPQTADAVRGERMALAEAGGAAGPCTINLVQLDDSTPEAGQWDPGQTSMNAREAGQDRSTIAYIGEFNSGASAISVPILNEAGILEVSPSNTALELTKRIGPAIFGAPDKYYPTGTRTYARVAPADHIQAGALAEWMKALHAKRLFVADDKQVYGLSLARAVERAARVNGIKLAGSAHIDVRARGYRALARRIRETRADAFFFGGITQSNAVPLYGDAHRASPRMKLFGSDGVADAAFARRLSRGAQRRMHITIGTVDPRDYAPLGKAFAQRFREQYLREPEPYAIYGYEAMSLLVDAMKRAGTGCHSRAAVRREVFATKHRNSVLGPYSIDKDGDVTTRRFGRLRVRRGKLVYDRTVLVKRDALGHTLG